MAMRPVIQNRASRGFTLIELLVVIAIIGILAAILIPVLSNARFKSKLTQCSNQFRQWGVIVNVYASDDGRSRLPSYRMGTPKKDWWPWIVSIQMPTNLVPHGLTLPLWYCPLRANYWKEDALLFQQLHPNRTLSTMDDLMDLRNFQSTNYTVMQYNWFIPRPAGDTGTVFPTPQTVPTTNPIGWPSRTDDTSTASQPFMTDWCIGEKNATNYTESGNGVGHAVRRYGPMRNINLGFVDGHVETRNRTQLRPQMGGGSYTIFY